RLAGEEAVALREELGPGLPQALGGGDSRGRLRDVLGRSAVEGSGQCVGERLPESLDRRDVAAGVLAANRAESLPRRSQRERKTLRHERCETPAEARHALVARPLQPSLKSGAGLS